MAGINQNLKKLDISKNADLTLKSYQMLSRVIIDKKIKLTHLNLDGNEIGDQGC